MKHVMGNKFEVVDAWFKQDRAHARCKTIFFEGNTIYSFGYHFPIACIDKDKGAILFNNHIYSMMTVKHQSAVWNAIYHDRLYVNTEREIPVFTVREPQGQPSANMGYFAREIDELIDKASRATSNTAWYLNRAQLLLEHANAYAARYGAESLPVNNVGHLADRVGRQAARAAYWGKEFPYRIAVPGRYDTYAFMRALRNGKSAPRRRHARQTMYMDGLGYCAVLEFDCLTEATHARLTFSESRVLK